MFGTRRGCVRILRLQFRKFLFERGARRDHGALRRHRGAEPAAGGTGIEVLIGFSGTELRDAAGDADLPVERGPIQHQRGAWIFRQLAPFAAEIVGVEQEAAMVDAFEQHDARGGLAGGDGGGKRHGGGLFDAGGAGAVEPFLDFANGICDAD